MGGASAVWGIRTVDACSWYNSSECLLRIPGVLDSAWAAVCHLLLSSFLWTEFLGTARTGRSQRLCLFADYQAVNRSLHLIVKQWKRDSAPPSLSPWVESLFWFGEYLGGLFTSEEKLSPYVLVFR